MKEEQPIIKQVEIDALRRNPEWQAFADPKYRFKDQFGQELPKDKEEMTKIVEEHVIFQQ